MDDERKILLEKLEILHKRNKIEKEKRKKYKNMTFAQVLQEKENKNRLIRFEIYQKHSFYTLIKRRHKELLHEWEDLFAEYFMGFLENKFKCIDDFLYVDYHMIKANRELRKNIDGNNT